MLEVRWHGRAQQGVVTAAKVLGETCLRSGKYVQAFPEFGPERMGAPVKAYNRISDNPIHMHCSVSSPGYVLIADPTLIGMSLAGGMETSGGVTEGALEDAVFIVNTPKSPAEMRTALELDGKPAKVFTVDASQISIDKIGRHIPNTPMLGALAKATDMVKLDGLIDDFRVNYAKKYSEAVIDGNVEAMKAGYETVRED
jgi:pyruvate ferredoxin oxidoreductase gamma subunit